MTTHFAANDGGDFADGGDASTTLCGLRVLSVIMSDRPATCPACSDAHARTGWTFPLPVTVEALDTGLADG